MTTQDDVLAILRARLLDGMREYMADGDVAYDESHVRECDGILADHAQTLKTAKDATHAKQIVRETVLKLNALNDRCEGELIETDQREDICAYIIRAGFLRDFNAQDEDVTEEWREW